MRRKQRNFRYLLPGQGRGARRRYVRNMIVAFVVGLLACGLLAWFFYAIE